MYIPILTNSFTGKTLYHCEVANSTLTYCGYVPDDQLTTDTTEQEKIFPMLDQNEQSEW